MSSVDASGWTRFWNRGRAWKAIVAAVVYLALYEGASYAVLPMVPFVGGEDTAGYVLVFFVIPIFIGAALLIVFGASVGWLRNLFARARPTGRGWMWVAVAVVLVFNLLRFASTDYSAVDVRWVLAWLLAGVMIGFAEEVITRGYVVRIMRSAGHREASVALVSAAVFALLHSVNLFSGSRSSSRGCSWSTRSSSASACTSRSGSPAP